MDCGGIVHVHSGAVTPFAMTGDEQKLCTTIGIVRSRERGRRRLWHRGRCPSLGGGRGRRRPNTEASRAAGRRSRGSGSPLTGISRAAGHQLREGLIGRGRAITSSRRTRFGTSPSRQEGGSCGPAMLICASAGSASSSTGDDVEGAPGTGKDAG